MARDFSSQDNGKVAKDRADFANIVLRAIREDELPKIAELNNSQPDFLKVNEGITTVTVDWVRKDWRNATNQPGQRYRGAFEQQGNLLAVIADWIVNPFDKYPWIGLLLVHKKWEGQGIGSYILHEWEEEVRLRGFTTVRIGVDSENHVAMKFWAQKGYKEINRRPWEREHYRTTVIVMEKKLA